MYDAAGEWVYNVGMPAKSGVAGGIAAVLPGQLGIGVFSPSLDPHGNSVRGVEVCRAISRRFGLHVSHAPHVDFSAALARRFDSSASNRQRSGAELELLDASGGQVRVIHLQGDILFSGAEVAVREFSYADQSVRELLLDFGHVAAIDYSSCAMIAMAVERWMNKGKRFSLSRVSHLTNLTRILRKHAPNWWAEINIFDDVDEALEASENCLLEAIGVRRFMCAGQACNVIDVRCGSRPGRAARGTIKADFLASGAYDHA